MNQEARLHKLWMENFSKVSPEWSVSVPARTEIIGNHTDHQGGHVIAATLDKTMTAWIRGRPDAVIRLVSENYGMVWEWTPPPPATHGALSLLGASYELMKEYGGGRGWEGVLVSDIPIGGGLSSSAAFCILLLLAQQALLHLELDPFKRAQMARNMESQFMGKPCGLMDQLTISLGGHHFMDFKDTVPNAEKLPEMPIPEDWGLFLIDTGMSHENLTGDYAAIFIEMSELASIFTCDRLADLLPEELMENLQTAVVNTSHRAVQRAFHFFQEQRRVLHLKKAWRQENWNEFLWIVQESGFSSWRLLQNLVPSNGNNLAASILGSLETQRILKGTPGAERLHGGGFGGLIQIYRPLDEEVSLRQVADQWNLRVERAVTGKTKPSILAF